MVDAIEAIEAISLHTAIEVAVAGEFDCTAMPLTKPSKNLLQKNYSAMASQQKQ